MGGIGIWQLVIVLLIVFLLFGTKRLKGLGADMGEAIQGFRKSMGTTPESEAEDKPVSVQQVQQAQQAQPEQRS